MLERICLNPCAVLLRACLLILLLATAAPSLAAPVAPGAAAFRTRLDFAQPPDFARPGAAFVTPSRPPDAPAMCSGVNAEDMALLADPALPARPRGSRPFELLETMPPSYSAAMLSAGIGLVMVALALGYVRRRLTLYAVANAPDHARPLPPFVIACPARPAVE